MSVDIRSRYFHFLGYKSTKRLDIIVDNAESFQKNIDDDGAY